MRREVIFLIGQYSNLILIRALLSEGNKVLFRVALAIFKTNENKILAVEDAMEVFQTVQNIPKGIIDCHKLMGVIGNFLISNASSQN
jgi:hypothetical protein